MPHVLVVEDEPDIREAVVEVLALAGFAVHAVEKGREGLDHLHEHSADVVVLDLVLPDMTGQEFMDLCRSDPALADVPVVVATASVNAAVPGAALWLPKPFQAEQLLDAIRRCLSDRAGPTVA